MTDEQLIVRIRSSFTAEVAGIEPPRGLTRSLRGELSGRSRWSRGLRRLPVPSFGGVVAVLGACCALAVAGVFIVLLGHRQPHPASTTGAAGASQLVSRLAVLRRPQTAADRSMPPSYLRVVREGSGERPIPSLTRLVATSAAGKTYLIVTPPKYSGEGRAETLLWPGLLGDQVSLVTLPGGIPEQPVPAAGLDDSLHTTSAWIATQRSTYFMEVVPDGVVRARLVFAHGTVYRPVARNLLIVHNPPAGPTGGIRNITWYGANGHVVPSSNTARRRAITFTSAAERACRKRLGRVTSIAASTACLAAYVAAH